MLQANIQQCICAKIYSPIYALLMSVQLKSLLLTRRGELRDNISMLA